MRAKHFDTSAHEAHNAYGVHGHAYLIGQGFDRSAGVDLTATIGCSTSISPNLQSRQSQKLKRDHGLWQVVLRVSGYIITPNRPNARAWTGVACVSS
jgi:hypothetical protein